MVYEICKLTGIFTLSLLDKHIDKTHIGLCRYYSVTILKNTSNSQPKDSRKNSKIYLKKGLDIIVQHNSKITNYYNITLDLNNHTYHLQRKPNEKTNNIHVNSGNMRPIIKEIPLSTEKRF